MHQDYFYVTRSQADDKPIAVTHQLPPLTTRPNPSFRVYDVDSETYNLLNYVQYRLYVAEANKNLKAEWKVAYEFLDYFGVENMRPDSFVKIIERMETDEGYFRKVYAMYTNEGTDAQEVPVGRIFAYC
eukprot:TRINITY_DN122120_c0_g1_i1.p6 TRINITY_DN122120_c0_g1~~TRINITY_DN122120_c0_g1_i1.p6  ORF type:complete len:129 (+),score=10.57 TRINITY_DN122120_c0_g1_i1:1548-1934(+)